MTGLKDHQIAQLVNAVRDELKPYIPHQCLREIILRAVMEYLGGEGLRIDGQGKGEEGGNNGKRSGDNG